MVRPLLVRPSCLPHHSTLCCLVSGNTQHLGKLSLFAFNLFYVNMQLGYHDPQRSQTQKACSPKTDSILSYHESATC